MEEDPERIRDPESRTFKSRLSVGTWGIGIPLGTTAHHIHSFIHSFDLMALVWVHAAGTDRPGGWAGNAEVHGVH
jgi:hypothetical protein